MDIIKTEIMIDADVILYHGNGFISKAIQFFDGTEVNHAAIYLGNNKVGEALAHGLVKNSVAKSISNSEYVIDRRLVSHPDTMQPVLNKALEYLAIGNRYGYEQILLLAFLGLTRKLPVSPILKYLMRTVLDQAAAWLIKSGDKQPMICSEFVYRSYEEALPASNIYMLDINPFPVRAGSRIPANRDLNNQPYRTKMHPDSLIAWAEDTMAVRHKPIANALLSSFNLIEQGKAAPEKKERIPLDALIEQYLDEIKKPVKLAQAIESSLRSPEMLASIKNFSEAYHSRLMPASEVKKILWSAPAPEGSIPDALSTVLKAVADFVTPGDLLKCSSLYTIGKILPK